MIKEGEQINRPFKTNLIFRIVFSRLLETMSKYVGFCSLWSLACLFELLTSILYEFVVKMYEKWYTLILISATFKVLALDIHFFFEVQWHNGIFHVFIHLWSFLNGLLPQLTTVKKGNLYLIIYLSSAYFTLKWDSIIPARNRWPWKISQVLCIFQYKSWVFFNGHKIEWFKIKAFVIECYLYTSNVSFKIIKTLWE